MLQSTRRRIKRLIEANNRARIDEKVLLEAWAAFGQSEALEDHLVCSRFDYGAYSLEPMFRKIIWNNYTLDQTTVETVESKHCPSVVSFLQCLFDVLTGDKGMRNLVPVTETPVGRRRLHTYKMAALSIRSPENLAVFEEWANRYSQR